VPGTIQLFGEAPLFQKLFFQLPQLLIQQKIGLMNQADQGVGGNFGWSALDIGPIGHIGPIARECEFSNF
jgi:hypothetical protein